MSRTKNAFNIIKSSAMLQFVIAICGLILPRMIISEYGSTINGLINTIKQILNYFSIVSLGLGAASQVALYKPLAKENYDEINGILSATRLFFNKTGYVFGALIGITAFIFPLLKNDGVSYWTIASLILICGLGSFLEYIVISKYKVLLVADQKNNIVSNIQMQGYIINTVVSVLLILCDASIILVQLTSTTVYIIRLFMTISYVRKHYPKINFKVKPNTEAISNRWDAFWFQLPDMIISYTPIIIVAVILGYNEASIYSVYNMIFFSLSMIVSIFSAGFAPGFGNVLALNEKEVLYRAYDTFEFVFFIISFFCYGCALVLCIPFISVYIKNSDGINYILPSLAILFTISGLFKSLRTPSNTLVQASGKFKENKKWNFIEAIVNVILSLILVNKFRILGILLASTITGVIRSIIYILYCYKNILKINPIKQFIVLTLNLLLIVFIYIFFPKITCLDFVEWFIKAILVAILNFVLVVLLNSILNPKAAKDTLKRLKKLVAYSKQ